jgi:hypothetical protein
MVLPTPETLYTSQIRPMLALGYSVIPLGVDKKAAVAWEEYQYQPASAEQLATWFENSEKYSAYGILGGTVSKLLIVDWDIADAAELFKKRFPHLLQTFTVLSGNRALPHYYYRVDFYAPTQKLCGGDLKAEGGYVVGPGSVIDGKEWTVTNPTAPRHITLAEYRELLVIFGTSQVESSAVSLIQPRPMTAPVTPRQVLAQMAVPSHVRLRPMAEDLRAVYDKRLQTTAARNDTLFWVACWARDKGCSLSETLHALTRHHADALPHASHRVEKLTARLREGQATIRSAFSQPPRPDKPKRTDPASRLPNTLREYCLKSKQTTLLRVLEGLTLRKVQPGTSLTIKEVLALVGEWICEKTLRKIFKLSLLGQRVFEAGSNFKNNFLAKPLAVREDLVVEGDDNLLTYVGVPGAGRSAETYLFPDIHTLCQQLGLEVHACDPVYGDDLASAKTYRAALEREFICRRPNAYAQEYLAARLGVSVRSIYNYHRLIPDLHQSHQFVEQPLTFTNLKQFVALDDTLNEGGGKFLVDKRGNRYPVKYGLACRLLKNRKNQGMILLRTQTYNRYWVGDVEPDWNALNAKKHGDFQAEKWTADQLTDYMPRHTANAPQKVYVHRGNLPSPSTAKPKPMSKSVPKVEPLPTPPLAPPQRPRFFVRPLPDANQETLAQKMHTTLADLSIMNARRLVYCFGMVATRRALAYVQKQPYPERYNPVGLLVNQCRRYWHLTYGYHVPLPNYQAQPARRSRRAKLAATLCPSET